MITYAKQLLAERSRNPPEGSNGGERTDTGILSIHITVPMLERKILQRHAAERVVNESRKYAGVLSIR